ncbi:2-oxo acid dehydrogenase subunit E2 [Pedobacter fastidiosus]|uniref:Dihydrolipoamide acetyltransferase component of pyruvate dehydrogenase complex n=1 Tax=Pedobacter fastidiosus TaxID=2765361 RepID=A0ABR7KUJ3_9SPHI|nr:dihydrolipoamide acetyltransferase family protein [Pedobacter fastidiosus]MBC6111765.1 2-oxo acid dehydrogenase subunit E2 [Pedobacter fastidiosus]
MAEVVRMPKMSDTMTEGVLAKWHVKVGDKVKSGDVLAEVETDKATMDLESYEEGTLLHIGIEEGKGVPIDAIIAVIGKEGEDFQAAIDAAGGTDKAEAPKAETAEAPKTEEKKEEAPAQGGGLSEEELAAKGVTVIRMPLLSDTMTEGVIAEWHKKVGDKVKDDDVLADVETDKATMEVMGYATGTLLHIGVEKGSAAKVNGIIAIVGPEGTDVSGILAGGSAPKAESPKAKDQSEAPKEEKQATTADAGSSAPVAESSSDSRVKASPLAKKIAKDKGIDLAQVAGSAEGGRIIKKDIENFKPSAAPQAESPKSESPKAASAAPVIPSYVGEVKFTEAPVSQMRKIIAKRLAESLFTAPHFYLTISIDMDNAMTARTAINAVAPVKVSFNDIVIKAVAVALKKHPAVNSSWGGDKIRFNEHTNIGVAMAVEDGLLVPVVRFADGKSLSSISAEVKDFGAKAKAKKLQPADWEGSTFTVSNLGMFGIDEFTSIINSPDGAILSVGAIQQVPVVKNGAVVPGNVMKLTLGCDHRVVDGATGAQFLQTLKGLLEEPIRLLA